MRAMSVEMLLVVIVLLMGCLCVTSPEAQAGPAAADKLAPEYHQFLELLGTDYRLKLRLPRQAEIEELGDLWPSVRPKENAAFLYAKAFSQSSHVAYDKLPPGSVSTPGKPYDGNLAPLKEYVRKQSRAFVFAKMATKLEGCNLPPLIVVDTNDVMGPPAGFRTLGRDLTDAAFVSEVSGNAEEAATLYLTCLQMGRQLQQNMTIYVLISQGINWKSGQGLESLIANCRLSQETLKEIIAVSQRMELSSEQLLRSTDLEVLYWKFWANHVPWEKGGKLLAPEYQGKDDFLAALEKLQSNFSLVLREPPWVVLDKTYDWKGKVGNGLAEGKYVSSQVAGKRHLLESAAIWNARYRSLTIRAAISLYTADKGTAPNDLAQLCPSYLKEVPTDPFSGKPFRYKKTDEGWLLWSIGTDLKDDNGQVQTYMNRWSQNEELAFPEYVEKNVEARSK